MAFEGELAVSDCVHATVDAMQTADVETTLHLAVAESESQELASGHDAVLLGTKQRQLSINRLIQCG
jgi:hypothetical protein